MKKIITLIGISGLLLCSGCSKQIEIEQQNPVENLEATQELFAMDTYMTVTAYGEEAQKAVDAAAEEIERLDALLSTGDANSEVAQINENGRGILSKDTEYLLERAMQLYEKTEGAFDITIYPVVEAWGFTTQNYRIPETDELKALLSLTDSAQIELDENKKISFGKSGMKIDFGGIAKGYTSSRIMKIWEEYEIVSGMVNLGGNVQVFGTKTDGSDWKIAVQSPDEDSDYLGILQLHDKAVITSGGYERYFEEDGKSYHHIIDPATGYPAENGLISVTIVSADGTLADGLSTSLFVMGKEKALDYWKENDEDFDAILMTEDHTLYVTEGIAKRFTSELPIEVIQK